jgi:hypothetical protein
MVRPWPCSVAPAAIIALFRAGYLNAIKASHPRYRFAIIETAHRSTGRPLRSGPE